MRLAKRKEAANPSALRSGNKCRTEFALKAKAAGIEAMSPREFSQLVYRRTAHLYYVQNYLTDYSLAQWEKMRSFDCGPDEQSDSVGSAVSPPFDWVGMEPKTRSFHG